MATTETTEVMATTETTEVMATTETTEVTATMATMEATEVVNSQALIPWLVKPKLVHFVKTEILTDASFFPLI
jgi:hypothetical protein